MVVQPKVIQKNKVLVVAPHADDEVLGAGGTIARLVSEGATVHVAIMTGHGDTSHPIWPAHMWEAIRAECRQAASILGVQELIFKNLPAACLDQHPAWKINKMVDELIEEIEPNEIYVPFAHDMHLDHASIAYAVSVSTRPYLSRARNVQRVLAYETLSETHLRGPYLVPAFMPQVYVDISKFLDIKLAAMQAYTSQLQADGQPRSLRSIRAQAELRGAHIGCEAAEAFVLLGEYKR